MLTKAKTKSKSTSLLKLKVKVNGITKTTLTHTQTCKHIHTDVADKTILKKPDICWPLGDMCLI